MALKYYTAYRETTSDPSNTWKNDFQALVNQEFENASDYYVVQKEDNNGVYQDLGVRLTSSYQIGASSSLKDDYKTVIFKEHTYNAKMGERYYFDNNYWITIDTGRSKSSSASCQVQRCGDFLRFYDDNGLYHSIPAIIGKSGIYDLNSDTMLMIPENQLKVFIKYDAESELIKWADIESAEQKYTRFILHGQAWRVTSIDKSSYIRNDVGYVELRLGADLIKVGSDDLMNNIADAFSNVVTVEILNGDTNVEIGQTLQLNTQVVKNDSVIDNPVVTYSSSDEDIATVDSNGLVTMLLEDTCVITATYGTTSDTINVTGITVSADNYTVDFSSSTSVLDSIKIGQSVVFTATAKNNGQSYADLFTFNLTDNTGLNPTNVASIITQDGTNCTVKCANVTANIGTYFRLYAVGTNKTEYITLRVKSLF